MPVSLFREIVEDPQQET